MAGHGCRYTENQTGATGGVRFLLDKNQSCGRTLDDAAEAEPGTQGDSAHDALGNATEIDGNHSEAVALQQDVGNFKRLFQGREFDPAFSTAHPEQARHGDAGGMARCGIKTISGIHQRAELIAGGLRQQGNKDRSLAGGGEVTAANFRQGVERDAADSIVNLSNAGWS